MSEYKNLVLLFTALRCTTYRKNDLWKTSKYCRNSITKYNFFLVKSPLVCDFGKYVNIKSIKKVSKLTLRSVASYEVYLGKSNSPWTWKPMSQTKEGTLVSRPIIIYLQKIH